MVKKRPCLCFRPPEDAISGFFCRKLVWVFCETLNSVFVTHLQILNEIQLTLHPVNDIIHIFWQFPHWKLIYNQFNTAEPKLAENLNYQHGQVEAPLYYKNLKYSVSLFLPVSEYLHLVWMLTNIQEANLN